jgi:hypothetical protein
MLVFLNKNLGGSRSFWIFFRIFGIARTRRLPAKATYGIFAKQSGIFGSTSAFDFFAPNQQAQAHKYDKYAHSGYSKYNGKHNQIDILK